MSVTFADDFNNNAGDRLPRPFVGSLTEACAWSARSNMSGLIPAWVLAEYSDDPEGFRQAIVSAGYGQRRPKGAVQIVPGGSITIVNAKDEARPAEVPLPAPESAPETSPASRLATAPSARRTSLYRKPRLKRELRARDCDRCRYCARRVTWGKGRAADSAVWDWVEPDGATSPENVVTACKACSEAKAGRSPKGAGMTLLPAPEPGKRHMTCDASDLGNHTCDASCDASKRHRDASPDEPAGQKRHTPAKQDDHLDRSKSSSRLGQQPVPALTARTRKAKPGSADYHLHVIDAFLVKTGITITAEVTDSIGREVLGRATEPVPYPLSYVLRAISSEDDPEVRWLSAAPKPEQLPADAGRPQHCGDPECSTRSRRREDPETGADLGPCWKCSPNSFAVAEMRAADLKGLAS